MKKQTVEKYGELVHSNIEMDELRKEECLCINCPHMNTCHIAKMLYEICKAQDMAMMITRCKRSKILEDEKTG